uniref:Glycosyltransferase n=1 Tax=Citrus paradisi TaxID=37656 RepID=A0A0A0QSL8_CITPA|nr:putative secondary product UDP-glucosyltransferase [Citrus x paradisi]
MESTPKACSKVHAVCIPSPFQSHIKAMLKLAKLLHHKGFHITFVNTEFNHRRLLKARGQHSLDGLPSFRFEAIPDGLPASSDESPTAQDAYSLGENIINNVLLHPFLNLLAKLNDSSNSVNPAVSCIISDGFLPFTITAAQQLGLPIVLFFTISACSFMGFKQFHTFKEKGLFPVKDKSCLTKEYLNSLIDWIPGMKDIRIRDLPSFIQSTDPKDMMFNLCVEATENASKASAIIIHTFDALEQQVLNALTFMFPHHLFTIGPLQLLLNQTEEQDGMLNSIGYNLLKEETECLQWLDCKEPKSVIYVNFGSFIFMNKLQLIEVAMGLVNSNHPFLWIIRPDLVTGETADLPAEFEVKAKEKGFVASWCPQEEVLKHPSIGGFLTHCGWNSIVESLCSGVPMICWPFTGDQPTNGRYVCNEWGVGMEINGDDEDVIRNEVEKLVREMMEGEKGKQMRNKAMEWKGLAEEAAAPHGSSSLNLDKLVNEILLSNKHNSSMPSTN